MLSASSEDMMIFRYVCINTIVGNGNPLQYSCLEIAWTEGPGRLQSMGLQSQTRLSTAKQQLA